MSTARDNILQRLRAAKPVPREAEPFTETSWGWPASVTEPEKLAQFCSALTANHAEIYPIQQSDLSDTLRTLSQKKAWQHAVIGTDGPYLNDFHQGLEAIQVTEFHQPLDTWKADLFTHVDVGITHTRAGIADTGALVLWTGPHEPRTLSLVPPCHVAIVQQSTLFRSLTDVMRAQQWQTDMPTNAVLISGPSKTADIQQTLAYGAHGPSELIVIVLTDQ